MHDPIHGVWESYPLARLTTAAAVRTCFVSVTAPSVRFVRILMTASSIPVQLNRSRIHGIASLCHPRALSWYDIRDGLFHDILRHVPDQEQTTTYCSSVDPWHEASDLGTTKQAQVGLTFFSQRRHSRSSGYDAGGFALRHSENAVAEVAYLKKRNYPISYIEMGEEADGQYFSPRTMEHSTFSGRPRFTGSTPRLSWVGRHFRE